MKFNDDKTIVDSGTTDIFFPTKVFQEVKKTFSDYFKVSQQHKYTAHPIYNNKYCIHHELFVLS